MPRFLTQKEGQSLASRFRTPFFVYSESLLRTRAREVMHFSHRPGFVARYAMKANSNANILRILASEGLHIDASSGYEVERAIAAGISPFHIQLTGQEMPENLRTFVEQGIEFNATSLHQLETFCALFPGKDISLRVNPGLGSGGTNRTNVGGPASSFGIWYEHLDRAKQIASEHGAKITKLHTHIGSGSDPEIWKNVVSLVLDTVAKLPDVTTVSLGGGFKVARMEYEVGANLGEIGQHVDALFDVFEQQYNRTLSLEIEPGTYLVAQSGSLVTHIMDIVDTGALGYTFLKINAGMTEVTRPSLYGAQHPLFVLPQTPTLSTEEVIVVGHSCESGDILTPAKGDPEGLLPRTLPKATLGDVLVIDDVGAYCASMSVHGYNSFPECAEYIIALDGETHEIRSRATTAELWRNEKRVY